jgi:nucleotide-binding universal stress UspA family protein
VINPWFKLKEALDRVPARRRGPGRATTTFFARPVDPSGMKLLLGVSGDEVSSRALARTVERVRDDDELTVAVVDREGIDRAVGDVLAEVRAALREAGLDADVRRLEGDPASTLVELAEREGFDRLVIGGGSESPMGKMELNEVEQYVLLNCRTTVTIVR